MCRNVCAGVLGVALLLLAPPAQAIGPESIGPFPEDLLAAPATNHATVTSVVFVLPLTPSTRPPTPIRKPEGRAVILKTGVSPATGVIGKALKEGKIAAALRFLNNPGVARHLSVAEYDRLRASVANGYLNANDVTRALGLARASLDRSGRDVPMAGWVTGLAAWRLGDYQTARAGFESVADITNKDVWLRAAGAFWAARAARAMGDSDSAQKYFQIAAKYDRTFYGLLARATLGQVADLNWDMPAYGGAHAALLARHPLARETFAHVAAGRLSAADQNLMQIAHDGNVQVKLAVLGYATRHGLPATAMKLAQSVEQQTGLCYDVAYYPLGGWIDAQDYKVDRALVHAIIRQESSFNPQARSGQGAVGLMQLMPTTATYVARVMKVNATSSDMTRSHDNLSVGQHYLQYLLNATAVDGDLLNLLMAYNAGPGNLAKWQKNLGDDARDPLLFMESIPSGETRAYVEKVMASYWIYRDRLGLANPTLTALSAGRTATYNQPATWASQLKLSAVWP